MKIIRPVEVTDSIVTENTAYPPDVNAWISQGYAYISGDSEINKLEFSGSENKLWVLVGGTGTASTRTTLYLASTNSSGLTNSGTLFRRHADISAEPSGSRVACTLSGQFLSIYNSSYTGWSDEESLASDPKPAGGNTVTRSSIIWSGDHIYWLRKYTEGGDIKWVISKWTETLSKVWEETYSRQSQNINELRLRGSGGGRLLLNKLQNGQQSFLLINESDGQWGIDVNIPENLIPRDAAITPDLSAIFYTVTGPNRGLYKLTSQASDYDTGTTVIIPSGQPTEPGNLSVSSDSARLSVSSGFPGHIIDISTGSIVTGTERSLFKTYEVAPTIPFNRDDSLIAVHPKQPDDLGIYNLWETGGWSQVTSDQSDYLTGDVVYQDKGLYEATVDNPGRSPEDGVNSDPPQWVRTGTINPWRMFDQDTSTQTSGATPMTVSFEPGVLVNGIAFFSVDAGTLQVTMTDPVEGLVYDSGEIQMLDNSAINDWYAYFFEPYVPRPDLALLDLPPYPDATITVTLTSEGQDINVGEIVFGSIQRLGAAQYGTSVGIIDFSRKEQDQFGNFSILQRRFSKRAEYDVKISTGAASGVQRTLANYRTTPVVWVGDENKDETIVYGYYRDFEILLSGPSLSDCTITVEGL